MVLREFGIEPYCQLGSSDDSIQESLAEGEACRSLR